MPRSRSSKQLSKDTQETWSDQEVITDIFPTERLANHMHNLEAVVSADMLTRPRTAKRIS